VAGITVRKNSDMNGDSGDDRVDPRRMSVLTTETGVRASALGGEVLNSGDAA